MHMLMKMSAPCGWTSIKNRSVMIPGVICGRIWDIGQIIPHLDSPWAWRYKGASSPDGKLISTIRIGVTGRLARAARMRPSRSGSDAKIACVDPSAGSELSPIGPCSGVFATALKELGIVLGQ